ncbi:MAG: hypothetical protein K2J76_00065 [Oscillospiraceae bacterium]|nr:hypothetical protein [Oscillospiraceae bacterium]
MTTKNEKNVLITNEEINKIEKELIGKLLADVKAYEGNKDKLNALIDKNRIGVFYDNRRIILIIDAACYDSENYLEWYTIAMAYDRNTNKIIASSIVQAESYSSVYNFAKKYVKLEMPAVRKVCHYKDSNSPFELKNNIIRFEGDSNILIDLDTENNISDADKFINELVSDDSIPKLDGEEIQKKDGVNTDVNDYIFFNKNIADIIAEDLGYAEPKNLYKLLYRRGIIYKTKDSRYSRRVRDKELQKFMGNEQLMGIKKSVYNKVRGVADNDNI